MPQNQPFCYFASFSFVLKTQFVNKPDSSKDLTIFLIASISLFEITSCCSQSNEFMLFFFASATGAATVNSNGIIKILAHSINTFDKTYDNSILIMSLELYRENHAAE